MSETSYNNFTNWETWNANLFVQNEETLYKTTRGISAGQIEQFIKNRFNGSGGFGDLFTEEAIEKINFSEIRTE